MNYPFTSVNTFLDFDTGHKVQWDIDALFSEAEPYTFTLEASETIDFSELTFSKDVGGLFFAIDDSGLKKNWFDSYYYRIKLETAAGNTYYSDVLNFNYDPALRRQYLMAAEIIRKEMVIKRFAGCPAYLLKRKNYGRINTQTVDPVSGVPMTDNADDCGVGFSGGYYTPLLVNFQKISEDHSTQLDPEGKGTKNINKISARFIGFPAIEVKDVIAIKAGAERFIITSNDPKKFPGTDIVLIQTCDMFRLPPSDSVYKIKLP